MTFRVFLHGLDSSSRGTKSQFFRKRYPDMIIPDFSGPLAERMAKLNRVLAGKEGLRIVGSSFGGLMAALFALENESRLERLILLAPAINLMAFTQEGGGSLSLPVWVFHGTGDEVIPVEDVKRVARERFTNLRFSEMDDDHSLHRTFKTFDWDTLLGLPPKT
jgi:alpha-beta hydrolase superfamily lysophospholipase